MDNNTPLSSIDINTNPTNHIINPLVEKVSELSALPITLKHSEIQKLINKVNTLLDMRLKIEVDMLKMIDDGLVYTNEEGEEVVSDKAVALYKSLKDSPSELVKVKMSLEGIATERKDVVHRFDTNSLLEALRVARDGRQIAGNGRKNVY